MSAPLSERVVRVVCLGFALWTLCAHATVYAGGSLALLIGLFALAAVAAGVASAPLRATRGDAPEPAPATQTVPAPAPEALGRGDAVALAIALAAAAVALWRGDPILTWGLWVGVLLFAAVRFVLPVAVRFEASRDSRRSEAGLFALAGLCALYALCVHRPDADDAFYVNLAVGAIDHPELPLLARDTLHGRTDLPIHYPAYRLHSWELWNAALARLTGLPAIAVFHFVSAALVAALVPLAHAALFRRLVPRCFVLATLAFLVVLVVPGDTHRWHGNLALVRIWQGKAVFLFVFLPLVHAYALRFAERGDRQAWLMLFAAQVAALGATSTAIWAAPVAGLVALACALRPVPQDLRRFALGAAACAYPLAAGLAIRSEMIGAIPELTERFAAGEQLATALATVFGEGRLHAVCVAALFAAWATCPPGPARRYAIVMPLAFALVLLNPWLDAWVRSNLSGPSLWRVLWVLPVPVLLALAAIAPLRLPFGSPRVRTALVLGVLALFTVAVPAFPGFDPRNEDTRVGWPELKLPPEARFARALNELAPGERVVAPPAVATWVPVFHDHAHPLRVRSYLRPLRARIGRVGYRDRHVMTFFTEGSRDHPRTPEIFERGLDLYGIRAVCLRTGEGTAEARRILRRQGFVKRLQEEDFEIWERR